MNYDIATRIVADVGRWDTREWEWHDVCAAAYWEVVGQPEAEYQEAVDHMRQAIARGSYSRIKEAEHLIQNLEHEIEEIIRRVLQRDNPGHTPNDEVVKQWAPNGRTAIRYAVTGELAEAWLSQDKREALTAGYRAADEKLQYDFSFNTTSAAESHIAERFIAAIAGEVPATGATFDPDDGYPGRFVVGGFDYLPGSEAAATELLLARLQAIHAQHDPDALIQWPPADFHAHRPNRA